jgi:hypothetical protein
MIRDTGWYKSSFSSSGNDTCVEVRIIGSTVGVRDSKDGSGQAFWVRPTTWKLLLEMLNRDELLF